MKRSGLQRREQLVADPEKVREFLQRGREKSSRKRRPVSPASTENRLAVKGRSCIACGDVPVDPAHLIPRGMLTEGQDDARAVVPLCRPGHSRFDRGELDLLPHLEPRHRVELAFAVERFGLLSTLERVTGTRWQPVGER